MGREDREKHHPEQGDEKLGGCLLVTPSICINWASVRNCMPNDQITFHLILSYSLGVISAVKEKGLEGICQICFLRLSLYLQPPNFLKEKFALSLPIF